jgi:V-type H+-transporting ATPase subunit G
MSSQALIQKLLKAEEEAEQIIARARENRTKKLKEARQAAEEELAVFKAKEQARFDEEMSALISQAEQANQTADEDAALLTVKQSFSKYGEKTVAYLVERVLDVRD